MILAGGTVIADGSADALSRQVDTTTEVRWTRNGERFVHPSTDSTTFVRELFAQYGEDIADVEVRQASLEDTYLALVRDFESGAGDAALRQFQEVTR